MTSKVAEYPISSFLYKVEAVKSGYWRWLGLTTLLPTRYACFRSPYLDFSEKQSYNNITIETPSHNMRHGVEAYVVEQNAKGAKRDGFP